MKMILKCATAWIIVVQHLISCIRRGVFSNIFIFFNELLLLLVDIHFLSWYFNLSDLCGIWKLRITLLNANLLAHFSLNFSEQKSILKFNHFLTYFWFLLKLTCWKHCSFELFLVLWKSYMLSCLTNEEKLLCLKYLGRILSANSLGCRTTKLSPDSLQQIMWSKAGSYSRQSYNLHLLVFIIETRNNS